MIRVLHVFGALDTGGAESRTMDLYRRINREKVQFDFLVHTEKVGFYEEEIEQLGGRIYRVPNRTIKNTFRYYKAINEFFQVHTEYSVVHGHSLSSGFLYLRAAKRNGVRVRIAHSRCGASNSRDFVTIVKEILKKLSRFYATDRFAVSEVAAEAAFGRKMVEHNQVRVIPNAIDTSKYGYDPLNRIRMRKIFDIEDNFVVGHIGRFSIQKNHELIIEIFSALKRVIPNATLILVGDGELKPKIKNKVKRSGLEESVIFAGIRSDVPDVLQAIDVILFPSFFEGLPGVILEAQASGVPCVISDKISKEVKITDLVNYVSLDDSIDHWVQEVEKFQQGFTRRNTVSEIIDAGYDIDSVAKQYEEFYLNSVRY